MIARACLALVIPFLASACEAGENVPMDTEPVSSEFQPETAVYQCRGTAGERTVVTRTRPNGLHLFLPPDVADLYLDCTLDRRASIWEHAKLSGVDFRAQGNEPGWVLEIREGDRLDLSYDYGQGELSVPIDQRQSDQNAPITVYSGTSSAGSLTVTLKGETCQDSMADEVYPTRVEVEFSGRRLQGCGRPLH